MQCLLALNRFRLVYTDETSCSCLVDGQWGSRHGGSNDAGMHRFGTPVEEVEGDRLRHLPVLTTHQGRDRESGPGFWRIAEGAAEMEHESSTPGRGTPESAAWFRDKLAELDVGQSALARRMIAAGDDRQFETILRSLRRMASGDARVSGEMRALLCLMAEAGMWQDEVAKLRTGEAA